MSKLNSFTELLSRHTVAIILALVTTVIVAFPQVYFRIDHADDGVYKGIELLPDSPWSPRVREVQDGHLNFGSMYWKEGKEGPYLFQPLGSIVVAYMGTISSLDINNTLLLSRIVLPPITFLLIYGFVYLLSREKLVALASTGVILFADSVISAHGLSLLSHGVSPEDFLSIGKPVNNTMIYIPFFGFLVTFWLFYRDRKWQYGALSALLLGLNFYNYFYTWTHLYAVGGILVLIFLLQKNWKEALRIMSVFVGALAVAVPYVINLYQVTAHPLYEELSMRIGVIETHAPLSVGFVVFASIIIFLFLYPRDDKRAYWFSLALLLAPFLTMNQQLLTGKVMQAAHYHWYFHKPIAIILVCIAIFAFFTRRKLFIYKNALAVCIIGVSTMIGAFIQVESYYRSDVDGGAIAIERQKYGPVMEWLSQHADKEDVVFGNDEVSQIVTIYTPLNVFYHRGAPYSSLIATEDRLLDILFSFYRLRGVDTEEAEQVFFAERASISYNMYHLHYRDTYGSDEAIPDAKVGEIISQYQETLAVSMTDWFEDLAKRYEVEYFVWDRKENSDWQIEQLSFLTKEAEFGEITVYRFPEADADVMTRDELNRN